jgi:hypothetical protein
VSDDPLDNSRDIGNGPLPANYREEPILIAQKKQGKNVISSRMVVCATWVIIGCGGLRNVGEGVGAPAE